MSSLHSLHRKHLPAQGKPGDVFYTTDTKEVFVALNDKQLVAVDKFFDLPWPEPVYVYVPGPPGKDAVATYIGPPEVKARLVEWRAKFEVAIEEALEDAKTHPSPHVRKMIEFAVLKIRNRVSQ